MTFYAPITNVSDSEALTWLSLHMNDVRQFLHEYNPHASIDDFCRLLDGNIRLGYEVVYDYIVPGAIKLDWLRDWMLSGSRVMMVTGHRGGGKTATVYRLLELYYDAGAQPYILGPPKKLPKQIKRVSSLNQVPPDEPVFVDEIGVRYSVRENAKGEERVADLSLLPVLRHTGRTLITATQMAALGDVNFSRLTDMIISKQMGLFGSALERDTMRDAIPDLFMPRTKYESHIFCNEFRNNLKLGLASFWDDSYSTPYTVLDADEVLDYISELLGDGMDEKKILGELQIRSSGMKAGELKSVISDIRGG